MLSKHMVLFDGILNVYPHRLVHLDIFQNVTPCHLHTYPWTHIHPDEFKTEIVRLCQNGALAPCGASQWVSPTIFIPKTMVVFDGSLIFEN